MASRLLFLERDTRRPVAISNESTPATATDAPRDCDDPAPGGIGTVADHGPPLAVSKSRLVAGLNSEGSSSVVRPVVGICLPTYNGAKHLPECVESILAQTHSEFELVIVDDCSPDDSAEIAKRYARLDSRVKVFVNDSNLGLVGNWNRSVSPVMTQTAARRYRSEVLAFHPVYGELRRVAASCRPPVQLSREFWARALGARWHAKVAERDRAHPDSSLREEWRKVARHYPRLARVPLGRRLVSKWRAMCDDAQSWVVGQKATTR